jgi:hypothetical protein
MTGGPPAGGNPVVPFLLAGLHRGDDQDTLDLIRELMDLGATLVLIGVDIPGSGLLGSTRPDPASGQWAFTAAHGDAAATQTSRRFDLADLGPFDYTAAGGMASFIEHLAGIEDQLRLLRSFDGMLSAGEIPDIPADAGPGPEKKRRPRNTVFDDHGPRPPSGE